MADPKKKKKPHTALKIFLGLLLVIIVGLAALAFWQRDNISAFIKAQNTSSEDIASEIADSKAVVQKEIEKYNIPIQRDFTLEEEEAIRKGTMTVEEAVSRLMSPAEAQDAAEAEAQNDGGSKGNNGGTDAAAAPDEAPVQPELTPEQQIVAKYLTEMYSLKAYYIGQLGVVENDLKAQYKAANGNIKNSAAIAKVVQSNMGRVINMEAECDGKVYAVLDNMRNELLAIGADTSIVDVAEDSYINEKSLRKSYYLSLYN